MISKHSIAGLLVLLSLGLAGSAPALARGGGGGGGGFHGGGGGFHAGSFGGSSFHGGSFGGSSFHSFSAPAMGATHISPSFGTAHVSPSFGVGHTSPSFHMSSGSVHSSGGAVHVPVIHTPGAATLGTRSPSGTLLGTHGSTSLLNHGSVVGGNRIGGISPSINHGLNPQQWQHNANWWNGQNTWHRDFDRDFDHHHFFGFGLGLGLWNPFWWDLWPDYGLYGYPYYGYPYYGYPYSNCSDYGYYDYGPQYGYAPAAYTAATPSVVDASGATTEPSPVVAEQAPASDESWGNQFLTSAREAFRAGQYSDALRLATHAAVEMPQSAKPHELMSLALFALKDYRGANVEAHAVLSLGPASDWPTLYRYYGDAAAYTKQLDALVDYIRTHQDAADARFVLAYQDLMMGHRDSAKVELEKVLGKVPQDQVAAKLLKALGGTPPAAAVQAPAPPVPAGAGDSAPGAGKEATPTPAAK